MKVESFVCWRWTPQPGYRSAFGPETVNTLYRMTQRHYSSPHRFICVTDSPEGIDPGVEVLPDFGDFSQVPSPHGPKNPSCYRRLRMFHPDAARWFGNRFVSMDLDAVITGDLRPVVERPEDIVLWGDSVNPTTHYNGSLVLMTAGSRSHVWADFDPAVSPAIARSQGQFGSDQAWISCALGGGEARWTKADGVYSFRNHIQPLRSPAALPANARVVMFHGQHDPWGPIARQFPFVQEHYR